MLSEWPARAHADAHADTHAHRCTRGCARGHTHKRKRVHTGTFTAGQALHPVAGPRAGAPTNAQMRRHGWGQLWLLLRSLTPGQSSPACPQPIPRGEGDSPGVGPRSGRHRPLWRTQGCQEPGRHSARLSRGWGGGGGAVGGGWGPSRHGTGSMPSILGGRASSLPAPSPCATARAPPLSQVPAGCAVSERTATAGRPAFQAEGFCSLRSPTQPSPVPTASTKPALGPWLVPPSIQQVHN